jgi:hypothetical protein
VSESPAWRPRASPSLSAEPASRRLFVTGAIALLWSKFPAVSAGQVKLAVTQGLTRRRASVVPPLLDAEAAYRALSVVCGRRSVA